MHGEEAIVSLCAVFISLYQCPPPTHTTTRLTATASQSCSDVTTDHRGDVMIPFYRGSTTYRDLAAGLEYRLNQYFVIHSPETLQEHVLKGGLGSGKALPTTVYDRTNSNTSSSCKNNNNNNNSKNNNKKCCFNGAYYCSRCSSGVPQVNSVKVQTTESKIKEYPKIVVRNFTRVNDHDCNDGNASYGKVEENWEVTEGNLCCFFYSVMVKSTDDVSPIIGENDHVSRPFIGRDHVHAYASDSVYGDITQLPQHIELKVGERLLRMGTTADQRFEDVFERLKRRNLHVHRLFDGVTGASILPCELIRHLSWKISSICADIVTSPVVGAGAKRQRQGNDGKEHENECNVEVGTLIILSEVSSTAGAGSTVCLTRGSGNTTTAIAPDRSDDSEVNGASWRYEQKRQRQLLMRRTTFGFDDDDDDDTVPLVDLFSPAQCTTSHDMVELGEPRSALKSYYLDDEDCFMSSAREGNMNGDDILSSTTPLRFHDVCSISKKADDDIGVNNTNNSDNNENVDDEEEEGGGNIVLGDSVKRARRRYMASIDRMDSSPIMVTQQCLPEFCLFPSSSSSSSSYEEEEEEDDDYEG